MSGRPFLPHGLPDEEAEIFRMMRDLTFRERCVVEKDAGTEITTSGERGHVHAAFRRKAGSLTLEVEYAVRAPENLVRVWVWLIADGEVVFSAWSSRLPASDQGIGQVEKFVPGSWIFYLRTRSEIGGA